MQFHIFVLTIVFAASTGDIVSAENIAEASQHISKQEKIAKKVKKYEDSDLNAYASRIDFYEVMQHFNFPNLDANQYSRITKNLNFKNPQSIKEFRKILKSESERVRKKMSKGGFDVSRFEPKSDSEMRLIQEKRKSGFMQLEKFKKDFFFDYILNEKIGTGKGSARVCFNVDMIRLGLMYNENDEYIPLDQKNTAVEKEVNDLVSDLSFSPDTVSSLSIHDPFVSCHALITVSKNELKELHRSNRVSSILPPEYSPAIFFNSH